VKGLSGKSVLVTGGGGAIGRAICRRFAEEGAKLLVADKNENSAKEVASEVRGQALVFDISDYRAAKTALGDRQIDVLVNNAGWDRFQNFADTKPEEWETLIDINLRGPLNMHHLVLPQMLARGHGRIVKVRAIPMKRVGQPEDIPGIVAFLACDEAVFITGQVISVSGGLTMAG
jgi:2-hydroxycyclohexanecarboxyl-CoA dehydrogenase